MSRSYRKPYTAPAGAGSAKQDKQLAARGVRRAQNRAIWQMINDPDLLLPHRLECSHNDVWGWDRDGKQTFHGLDGRDWDRYTRYVQGIGWERLSKYYSSWPPKWYVKLLRK